MPLSGATLPVAPWQVLPRAAKGKALPLHGIHAEMHTSDDTQTGLIIVQPEIPHAESENKVRNIANPWNWNHVTNSQTYDIQRACLNTKITIRSMMYLWPARSG